MKLADARGHDAHCHIKASELGLYETWLQSGDYRVAFSLSHPGSEDFSVAMALRQKYPSQVFLTMGVHPWACDSILFNSITPHLAQASLLGEIGLDKGWTDVPLARQKESFREQLAYAQEHKMGVVLHIHNREQAVLEILRDYMLETILVHWYTGDADVLDALIRMDCYFTAGPDAEKNQAVRRLIEKVPLNRLLAETDGIDALAWAGLLFQDSRKALQTVQAEIARIKNISLEEANITIEKNFDRVYQ